MAPTERYEPEQSRLWVHWEVDADELVPREQLDHYREIQREGENEEGETVEEICFVFADTEAASYNFQPVHFSRFRIFTGTLEDPEPYEPENPPPDFDTETDFGL